MLFSIYSGKTDESINANKTCRTAKQHTSDEEPWPYLFFVVLGTASTEGFIDFPEVLSVNENYLFEHQPIRITDVLEAIQSDWIISNKRETQAFRVFFPLNTRIL